MEREGGRSVLSSCQASLAVLVASRPSLPTPPCRHPYLRQVRAVLRPLRQVPGKLRQRRDGKAEHLVACTGAQRLQHIPQGYAQADRRHQGVVDELAKQQG